MAIQVGDVVAYRAEFLRSIGCYAGDFANSRRRVRGLRKLGDRTLVDLVPLDDLPSTVIDANLVVVGSPEFQRGE
jgi:hypothetical protein